MAEKTITVTLPEGLHEKVTELVDAGLFTDFGEAVRAGLRELLLEHIPLNEVWEPNGLSGGQRFAYHLRQLRKEIKAVGGLFPGKTPEEVIEVLRQTREQIFKEKYARHFGLE